MPQIASVFRNKQKPISNTICLFLNQRQRFSSSISRSKRSDIYSYLPKNNDGNFTSSSTPNSNPLANSNSNDLSLNLMNMNSNSQIMPLLSLTTNRNTNASKEVKLYKGAKSRPSSRHFQYPVYNYLYIGPGINKLTATKKRNGGRNHTGHVTVRGVGGGNKRRVRIIDYLRNEKGPATVLRIERDPNRPAHIALIQNNESKSLSYIIAPETLRAGDTVESFRQGLPKDLQDLLGSTQDPLLLATRIVHPGNVLRLSMIPIGIPIHCISLTPTDKMKLVRVAGGSAKIIQKLPQNRRAIIELQSGEQRTVPLECVATIGKVSNSAHRYFQFGKAGRARWYGHRPKVRGVAMNACDHPHGGGRGKSKGNVPSQSRTGVLAHGYKTRRGKNQNRFKVKDRPRFHGKRHYK